MRNRKRQRQNRKKKHHEELLDRRNSFGYKDVTAYEAVKSIRNKESSAEKKLPSKESAVFLCPN
ncbi:MAG: hypothetical protein IJG23_04180 [Clostridia bacterium]|nr:hypothetical protein [Clostridia bacterium]